MRDNILENLKLIKSKARCDMCEALELYYSFLMKDTIDYSYPQLEKWIKRRNILLNDYSKAIKNYLKAITDLNNYKKALKTEKEVEFL